MNSSGVHVQIMWKEIAIIFLCIYLMRCLTDFYIVYKYKKLNKAFYAGEWEGLEKKMIKHQNICNVFSDGPFNKNIRSLYNGLCVALASIGLLKEDEETFLRQLNCIKKDGEYEMKAFMLTLYYNSRGNKKEAIRQYQKYLSSNPRNQNMQDILEYIYEEKRELPISSAEGFQNPAIIKLLNDNKIALNHK